MQWKYKGHNNHVNEDDYECTSCGKEYGFASYVDPNEKEKDCFMCGDKYTKEQNAKEPKSTT